MKENSFAPWAWRGEKREMLTEERLGSQTENGMQGKKRRENRGESLAVTGIEGRY